MILEHDGDSELDEEYEYDEGGGGQTTRGRRTSSRKGEGVNPPLDDATFKERLSTMGKGDFCLFFLNALEVWGWL